MIDLNLFWIVLDTVCLADLALRVFVSERYKAVPVVMARRVRIWHRTELPNAR